MNANEVVRSYTAGAMGFRQADLTRADLSGEDLSWADLTRANLTRADLSWANLKAVKLDNNTQIGDKRRLVW